MTQSAKISYNRILENRPKAIEGAIRQFIHWMELLGWSPKDIYSTHVALIEALNNAYEHGNKSDQYKKIFFYGTLTADEISLRICDEGRGFSPQAVPDPTDRKNVLNPRGRGLFLMKKCMYSIQYKASGTELFMKKYPSADQDHQAKKEL
ncbi:MAG: ATP-binding protein [Planctomycetia bacterium]|nr:ATP-binding protein [Planctomycetia bacterium]